MSDLRGPCDCPPCQAGNEDRCFWLLAVAAGLVDARVADQLDELARENEWPRIVIGGVGDAYRTAARMVRGADR